MFYLECVCFPCRLLSMIVGLKNWEDKSERQLDSEGATTFNVSTMANICNLSNIRSSSVGFIQEGECLGLRCQCLVV